MGYYIQGPVLGKDEMLVKEHGAREVQLEEAQEIAYGDSEEGIVCVVDNGSFEAAGFAPDYDVQRPRHWYTMSRERAAQLSGFRTKEAR